MPPDLALKLDFVLKALSTNGARVAAEIGVDKATVRRWVNGSTEPAPHNLSQLTRFVAARIPGFTGLDWERDLDDLGRLMGATPSAQPTQASMSPGGLPLGLTEESLMMTRLRGGAYEGFYRSTRPYAQQPDHFVRDHFMLRVEPNGAMSGIMNSLGVIVRGWVMMLHNQLFFIGSEATSGAYSFAIFNGVSTVNAAVIDGIVLYCALDTTHTPTASRALFERTGYLSGDRAADDAHFAQLETKDCFLPETAIAPEVRAHLLKEIGPSQVAFGGDWLLRLPLGESMARGLNPRGPTA